MWKPRIKRFGKILATIPPDVWLRIVRNEPEWRYIGPYQNDYCFGGFSSLMVMIGLNSYQLKGKAEQKYWQILHHHLHHQPTPTCQEELEKILIDFYQKERLPTGKIKRIHRFFSSPSIHTLWDCQPDDITSDFQRFWVSLARDMNQPKTAKTICFALKCLGISLLLKQNDNFDFSPIPIPVDSRVIQFTQKTNLTADCSSHSIQRIWNEILNIIQEAQPSISMIHLDSLIWQIGTLEPREVKRYFEMMQISPVADDILPFIGNPTPR